MVMVCRFVETSIITTTTITLPYIQWGVLQRHHTINRCISRIMGSNEKKRLKKIGRTGSKFFSTEIRSNYVFYRKQIFFIEK